MDCTNGDVPADSQKHMVLRSDCQSMCMLIDKVFNPEKACQFAMTWNKLHMATWSGWGAFFSHMLLHKDHRT